MDLKNTYKQLTSVDIDEQRRLWDERGKGYYGEFLVFCELYKSINGFGKILMNLNIPTQNSKYTEIDLLLIHETGLYVFEIKHYKGTIYGRDTDPIWTQYFPTFPNQTFKNPIQQNEYHIQALKQIFPNLPIHSVVVFTNLDCNLKVAISNQEIDVCTLRTILPALNRRFQMPYPTVSLEGINDIFNYLSAFSKMQKPVTINAQEASFFSWIEPAIIELENKKNEVEQIKNSWTINNENLKKTKKKHIALSISVVTLCVIVSFFTIFDFNQNYNDKISSLEQKHASEISALEEKQKNEIAYLEQKHEEDLFSFKQKFLHVDEIGNEYIDALNEYVKVSNVKFSTLSKDAVSFTARIAMNNDTYGILLTQSSKYIVMTTSGKVYEYDVFGEHLKYSVIANRIGKGIRSYGDLAKAQFFGISNVKHISYIKITGIELFKLDTNRTTVKTDLEIELYSK
ncbi:MAG: NERD domain-containing protein [Clostridia bacterium]|nr:NERD domain-containing protein [Clostridia bacterium]